MSNDTTQKTRHQTPGRGGSAPMGAMPKRAVSVSIDADVLAATRARVGARGLSAEVERLLRGAAPPFGDGVAR